MSHLFPVPLRLGGVSDIGLLCSWKKAEESDFPVPGSSSPENLLSWARKVPAEHIQALRQLGSLTTQGPGGGAVQQPNAPKHD